MVDSKKKNIIDRLQELYASGKVDHYGMIRAYEDLLSEGQKKRGSHYTPKGLARYVTRTALDRMLQSSVYRGYIEEEMLQFRVCDPACGGGIFLVEACQYIATKIADESIIGRRCRVTTYGAWNDVGVVTGVSAETYIDDMYHPVLVRLDGEDEDRWVSGFYCHVYPEFAGGARMTYDEALQKVATHCIYGIDIDPVAVMVTKMSLSLLTGLPLDAFDDHIRHGDFLVGSSESEIDFALQEMCACLPHHVDRSTAADVYNGVYWETKTKSPRKLEREIFDRMWDFDRWGMYRDRFRAEVPAFHFELEFPRMDLFLGNPPFLGGGKISGRIGVRYKDYLKKAYEASGAQTDLCAYFFQRAGQILLDYGKEDGISGGGMSFISTNTISQGDTRRTGLQWLLQNGFYIYNATSSMPWPGDANVHIAVTHLQHKGLCC